MKHIHRSAYLAVIFLLPFWSHVTIVRGDNTAIYYLYDSVALFAMDGAVFLTIACWVLDCLTNERPLPNLFTPKAPMLPLAALVGASLFSIPGSPTPWVSLSFALHLLLLVGLVTYTIHEAPSYSRVVAALAIGIILQGIAVASQIATQTTYPVGTTMGWEHELPASQPGASVVETVDGMRWLRAYGTFPHPNILAGYASAALFPLAAFFLAARRPWAGWLLALPFLAFLVAALTFSRAGVIAMLAGLAVWGALLLGSQRPLHRRFFWLLGGFVALEAILVFALGPLVQVRLLDQSAPLEGRSTAERTLLYDHAYRLIVQHPLLGVGAGAYVVAQTGLDVDYNPPEPVHNVFLLVLSETGLMGGLAWLALWLGIMHATWRRRRHLDVWTAAWCASLAALFVVSLLDHYLWSLAPGRVLLWIMLGLWATALARIEPCKSGS